MSRKPQPARSGDRSRTEITFDRPQLLPQLFGQYDQNLVALENRLGVFITARGDRVGLEGTADSVALARDVLNDLYRRLQRGDEIDTGLLEAVIAMAAEPTLDGIVQRAENASPPIMIRTRKKTIVPRSTTDPARCTPPRDPPATPGPRTVLDTGRSGQGRRFST